jgi:hypothetical protein
LWPLSQQIISLRFVPMVLSLYYYQEADKPGVRCRDGELSDMMMTRSHIKLN